jgi:hypothetical protein
MNLKEKKDLVQLMETMEQNYLQGSEIPTYLKMTIFGLISTIIVLLTLIIRKINYRIKTYTL